MEDEIVDTLDVELRVNVFDPDGNSLQVSFYDARNDELIGEIYDVASDSNASVIWTNLNPNSQYSWYAVVSDQIFENTSLISSFSTGNIQSNEPPLIHSETPLNNSDNIPIDLAELIIVMLPKRHLLSCKRRARRSTP